MMMPKINIMASTTVMVERDELAENFKREVRNQFMNNLQPMEASNMMSVLGLGGQMSSPTPMLHIGDGSRL